MPSAAAAYSSVTSVIPDVSSSAAYSSVSSTIPALASAGAYSSETDITSGGIHGRQFAQRLKPNTRIVLNDISINEIGPGAVGTDELVGAAVTPAKLDRAYDEPITTISKTSQIFQDITGVTATTLVEVNDEDALSFPDAVTTGARTSFEVPDDYDSTGNIEFYLRVSASTSAVGNFGIDVDYRKNGGAVVSPGFVAVAPSATANVQTLVGPVLTLTSVDATSGDGLVLLIERDGADLTDTHTGNMQLFSVVMRYAVS